MRKNYPGFTLMEIMVVVVIMALVTMLALFTMSNYIPTQHLMNTVGITEQILDRAQSEVHKNSMWSCVSYDNTTRKYSIYMDTNADYVCGNTGDLFITDQQIDQDVHIATTSECGSSVQDFTNPIWFDLNGAPNDCTSLPCVSTSYQIILINSTLPKVNQAREVEVVSSGLISAVKRGEIGDITTVAAQTEALQTIPGGVVCPSP